MEFWQRWIDVWGFDTSLVDLAVEFAQKRGSNLSYVNTILADWHTQNIHTLEKAKKSLEKFNTKSMKTDDTKLQNKKYADSEIDSIFDNVKEIEL